MVSEGKGVRQDPRAVFEILAREHCDMLATFVSACLPRGASVEDVVQEALVTAWRKLDEFDVSQPFGPWLRGIAWRILRAEQRMTARRLRLLHGYVQERIEQQMVSIERQPGDTWGDKLERLHGCIEDLPAELRQILRPYYWADEPLAGIAQRLNLAYETVKKRLQRARLLLAGCLQSHSVLAPGAGE